MAPTVLLHPGRPDGPVMVAALERMLVHRDPTIVFTKLEQGNVPVPQDRPAQAIVDAWDPLDPCSVGAYGVIAKGRGSMLVILAEDYAGDMQGRLRLHWEFDPALTDGFVDLLVDLSVQLSSPLAVLSHRNASFRQREGWDSRVGSHLMAVREAFRPGRSHYGLFRGLAGVAHRMILGDELVAMFGEDRLGALPAELAQRHRRGRWVLTPTTDTLDWTYERWCPGEEAIIEALGPEHFYNPLTGALPSVVPELPQIAPYPCRTRVPRSKEWVKHNW